LRIKNIKDRREMMEDRFFWSHLFPVFLTVLLHTRDRDTLCAAIMHDVEEDTSTKYQDIFENFNQNIADIIFMVSHDGDKKRGYYFPRLTPEWADSDLYKKAVVIKFADRLCNLSQMDCWNEKRQKHYLKISKFWKTEQ
jgi:(p)ppGpp synthase/HD superfamily hydrolase